MVLNKAEAGRQKAPSRRASPTNADVKAVVQRRYGAFAEAGGRPGGCCTTQVASTSTFALEQGLYTDDDLARVPDRALDLSRGCGNPTGFAELTPGGTVIDFGCGGGIDIILAAGQVGPEGRVVGVDFAAPMIERARENIAMARLPEGTVELRLADLADTGLGDACADFVISNCVINLSPDKEAVYREAFRILRPGGRLAISDVVSSADIHPECRARLQSEWVGCLGGTIPESDYLRILRRSGFADIDVVAEHQMAGRELEAVSRCPGPAFGPAVSTDDLASVEGKVVSINLTATKA